MESKAERLPLTGYRVVLLRSQTQAQKLNKDFTSLGAEVILCPMIEIIPNHNVLKQVDEPFLRPYTTLIFTSTNGVKIFMQALSAKGLSLNVLVNKRIIAIGPKTAEAIKDHGLTPSAIPDKFVSEKILDLFSSDLKDEKILIPTASGARKILLEELSKRKAQVTVLPIYENVSTTVNDILIKDGDYVIFTSPSTAENFFQSPFYSTQRITAFCIGEITRKTVEKYMKENILTSKESTSESLLQCVLDFTLIETMAIARY